MKTKKNNSNGSGIEQMTAEEKMFADQVATEFVMNHKMISTDKKLLFLWDGNCYRSRSKEYLEHLVQPETPSYLRNTFHHVINNIIIRTYVEANRLQSAYCFDENGDILLNCANGILRWHQDPQTGEWSMEEQLESPNPDLYFTGALAANYDPLARCPISDRALLGIQPDKKDREALWSFGAYTLIPDCRLEQCQFWKGLGEAGKGTAVKIFTSPLGEDLITNQDMSILGDAKRYGLSLLKYAMLNLSSELSDRVIDDTSIWKKLVVGEYEMQRNLYEQFGKMKSGCKHIIQGNNLPNLKKATNADIRRIVPIAFMQKFSKEDRDVELKLKMETERDGHLAQMVKRVAQLLSMRALPVGGEQSVALTRRMCVRLDPTGYFLENCTYIEPLVKNPKDTRVCGICCFREDLIWAYNTFMEECGMHQMVDDTGRWLGKLYDDHNIVVTQPRAYNPRRVRVLLGIDLSPKWRRRLTKECGVRPTIPCQESEESLEELFKYNPWMRKYYHPKHKKTGLLK